MTTSFLRLSSLTFLMLISFHSLSYAFEWPFSTEEFQKKLSSRDLAPAIRFYARGPYFLAGQRWSETRFKSQLEAQNYRIRESEQILLEGDAKKLSLEDCRQIINQLDLAATNVCWSWQTHQRENYIVVINENQVIESTWLGPHFKPYWKATLDPVLVAQYRGQQPIMQNELRIADFPVNCMNATMAIEDSEFLEHSGLSYMGLTRSLFKNISQMRYAQGGSTITQQLVKNYFLTPEKTLKRKLKELYLSVKLESEWNKDQILETYLNIIYMGQSGAFQVLGFGAAAQYYFNKPVQKLNLSECAMMAAIVNNPGLYNPWKNTDKTLQRRNLVLSKMLELKLINQNEYNLAIQEKAPIKNELKAVETAPYFFEAVRQQIASLNLSGEARSILTSLDLDAQQWAQNSLQKHIEDLEKNKKNLIKNKKKGLGLEGLVISTENKTGLITVFVGGQNFRKTQFNRALNSQRQIGSLIKPFIYLLALENGLTPESSVPDTNFTWAYENKKWSPENYDKKFRGDVPLYYALKESLNAPTAYLAQQYGLDSMKQTMNKFGFKSDIPLIPAASLGSSSHYAIEVVDAYRGLANFGALSSSGFIEKISDQNDQIIFEHNPSFIQVYESAKTAVLVGMMKTTLISGTAAVSQKLGWTQPAAGKTGTTTNNKDAWFSGFTPYQTTVVWLGYDQPLSSQLTGASGAVPIWINYMKPLSERWANNDFQWPQGVEIRDVREFQSDFMNQLIFID